MMKYRNNNYYVDFLCRTKYKHTKYKVLEYVKFCKQHETTYKKFKTALHHIIPRCVAPKLETKDYNLVWLTHKDHYIAHSLLTDAIYNPKFNSAWWLMSHMDSSTGRLNTIPIGKTLYAKLVEQYKRFESERLKNKKQSYEHIMARSKALKGRVGGFLGKHHTEETKQKIREANSGENSYMYGRHHTKAFKDKVSKFFKGRYVGKKNHMYKTKRKWFTNDEIDIFVEPKDCPKGFYPGRCKIRGKPAWNSGTSKRNKK